MRFLFYATNGFGIGHVARTLALARQLRRRAPKSQFLFLTDSEATNLIWREGFASVKTIPVEAVKSGRIDVKAKYAVNQALVASTYAGFQPDVIVVDAFPAGRTDELLGILINPMRRIFICREKTQSSRENRRFRDLLGAYELVLVPHLPGESELSAPKHVTVQETGAMLIRSRSEGIPREEARARLGLPKDGFIVFVGFGGGGDERYAPLVEAVLEQAKHFPDWIFAVAEPPLFTGRLPLPDLPNFTMVRYFPLAEVWSAFDGAVSALGNNTTMELLHNGVPSVFLPPRELIEDDQISRRDRISKAKAGIVIEELHTKLLREGMKLLADAKLRAEISANAMALVPENGAELAADIVLDYLKTPPPRIGGKPNAR